ncbi:MAG: hypothetical protein K6A93_07035 [Bacteroidaceae bacterium]|nr:hypothetical protein [Bacteroidaceae bacterium]
MKRIFLLSAVSLLMVSVSVSAQTITISDISVTANGTSSIELSINDANAMTASGFIITLPEGFTFMGNNGFAAANHESGFNLLSNNIMKIALYSMDNTPFKEGEGATITLLFKAGVKEGTFEGKISNVEYATVDTKLITGSDINFNIVVSGLDVVLGDANNDGKLTIADYTAIAHYILGKVPENFNEKAADVNGDGQINMADYIGVAHLLLYGTIEKPKN